MVTLQTNGYHPRCTVVVFCTICMLNPMLKSDGRTNLAPIPDNKRYETGKQTVYKTVQYIY